MWEVLHKAVCNPHDLYVRFCRWFRPIVLDTAEPVCTWPLPEESYLSPSTWPLLLFFLFISPGRLVPPRFVLFTAVSLGCDKATIYNCTVLLQFKRQAWNKTKALSGFVFALGQLPVGIKISVCSSFTMTNDVTYFHAVHRKYMLWI